MKNFEKALKEGGENNERFAEMESVAIIKRVHGSSLAAMGIFEFVSSESAFIAKELANDMIGRTNLPLEAIREIKSNNKVLDREKVFEAKRLAIENIWHIQDCIKSTSAIIASLQAKN